MHKRPNYKQEMSEIIKLRKDGYTSNEISELTGIPRGTITARLSRMKANITSHEEETKQVKQVTVPQKEKTLNDFQPRDMIKHLYNLGYRIKDNSLYVMTLQKVNIQSVLSE